MKFYEPHGLKKAGPALLTLGIAASCAFALSAPSVFAGFTSRSVATNNKAVAGRLQVELVDANGSVSTSPVISVTGAMPSMAAKTSTVRFRIMEPCQRQLFFIATTSQRRLQTVSIACSLHECSTPTTTSCIRGR